MTPRPKATYPPFQPRWTQAATEQFRALEQNPAEQGRFKQVVKALRLLLENPRHPGLHTHPYNSLIGPHGEKIFEAYAQNKTPGAYRIFWCDGPDPGQITIVAITEHP